jgi:hypothetical protein
MSNENFTISFSVDQSPDMVFAAINNVRDWWSQAIEGNTDKLGAVFYYHYQDIHRCTIKVTELEPAKKVVWHVLQNYFNLSNINEKTEWTGTDIVFEISREDDKTVVQFTHVGLVPAYECYSICSDGWGTYIKGSLHDLIAKGKGQPNIGEAITDSEKALD